MKWVESKDVGGQLLVWVKAPNTDHWFLLWEALSWYPTSLGETKMGKMQFLKVQSLSTLVCSWCFSWPVWEHTNHNLQFPPLQRFLLITLIFQGGFPGGSVVKNPPANAGDVGSVPRLGRCPGKGHGNPLQYSCLENPMDWGACRATVHGVTELDTAEATQHAMLHALHTPLHTPKSSHHPKLKLCTHGIKTLHSSLLPGPGNLCSTFLSLICQLQVPHISGTCSIWLYERAMLPEKEKSNKTREWGDGHGERWEGAKDSLQLTETKEQKTLISVCFVLQCLAQSWLHSGYFTHTHKRATTAKNHLAWKKMEIMPQHWERE